MSTLPRLARIAVALAFGVSLPLIGSSSASASCTGTAPDAASAKAQAAACGASVEVTGLRDASRQVFANPNGTTTMALIPLPYLNWTMINKMAPSQSYWSTGRNDCPPPFSGGQCAKVGYLNDGVNLVTYRSMWNFATTALAGQTVTNAYLSVDLLHSWSCANKPTELRQVNSTINSSTTWSSNVGSWGALVTTVSNQDCADARVNTQFNGLTSLVQAAANGGSQFTLGLKAQSETDQTQWKKFDAASVRIWVTTA